MAETQQVRKTDNPAYFLLLLVKVAAVIFTLPFVVYACFFFMGKISHDTNIWGGFGSFVGGTIGPAMSFLSFIALVMALKLQHAQLEKTAQQIELSNAQLEFTRKELEQAASDRKQSAEALQKQIDAAQLSTKLAVINSLHQLYSSELDRIYAQEQGMGEALKIMNFNGRQKKDLGEKIKKLSQELDVCYRQTME